jgi:hypothetical protein
MSLAVTQRCDPPPRRSADSPPQRLQIQRFNLAAYRQYLGQILNKIGRFSATSPLDQDYLQLASELTTMAQTESMLSEKLYWALYEVVTLEDEAYLQQFLPQGISPQLFRSILSTARIYATQQKCVIHNLADLYEDVRSNIRDILRKCLHWPEGHTFPFEYIMLINQMATTVCR